MARECPAEPTARLRSPSSPAVRYPGRADRVAGLRFSARLPGHRAPLPPPGWRDARPAFAADVHARTLRRPRSGFSWLGGDLAGRNQHGDAAPSSFARLERDAGAVLIQG